MYIFKYYLSIIAEEKKKKCNYGKGRWKKKIVV